jgi:hypothetical protein
LHQGGAAVCCNFKNCFPLQASQHAQIASHVRSIATEAIAARNDKLKASSMHRPHTSQEFKSSYRSLKTDASEVAAFVSAIPCSTYQRVFKSDLDAEVMEAFAMALSEKKCLDASWCKTCLAALSGVDRYSMTRAMVTGKTKALLVAIEKELKGANNHGL